MLLFPAVTVGVIDSKLILNDLRLYPSNDAAQPQLIQEALMGA
jgi:hypothetical protein